MNISILQGPFLPVPAQRGGAIEKMWFRLGQEFARHGHAVTHVSRRYQALPVGEEIGGVRHVRVSGFNRPRAQWAGKLRDFWYTVRAVSQLPDADVVVTNTFWAPMLVRKRHGALYVDVQRMPRGQLRFYRRAARLRANSSAVARAIAEEVPSLAERVRIIPNPLTFVPPAAPAWERKSRTVLYAGRLHPEKGIELLLRAWAARNSDVLAGWELQLVGPARVSEGGGGEKWVSGLRRRFAAGNIRWTPAVYDEGALFALCERAAVFVYPSLAERGETFGSAILEAMSAGTVPVVSDLLCFRDLVRTGYNGIVFDHRAPRPEARLVAALELATGPDRRLLGERAATVRDSHAPGGIALQFLEDFARLRSS